MLKIDFQVEAMIGYLSRIYDPYNFNPWTFTGQTSDWSNTQIITISASPNPTPTPTVPEFPMLTIMPLFLFVVLATVVYARKKSQIKIESTRFFSPIQKAQIKTEQ